jgi:hypothetical protein
MRKGDTCQVCKIRKITEEKPMTPEKTTPVPDELLWELNRLSEIKLDPQGNFLQLRHLVAAYASVVYKLPLPPQPPPDPLEEAGIAYAKRFQQHEDRVNSVGVGGYWNPPALKVAIARYLEVKGLPPDEALK